MNTRSDPKPKNFKNAKATKVPRPVIVGLVVFLSIAAIGVGGAIKSRLEAGRAVERQNYLRQVALAAILYADDKGKYPCLDGDWDQTIDLLHEEGYLSTRDPSGPTFEGLKAPYSRRLRRPIVLAWDATPETDEAGREFRTLVDSNLQVVRVREEQFQEIKVLHDRYARKVLRSQGRRSGS